MLTFKGVQFQIKSIDEDNYTVRGIFSTASVDRHGEVVDQGSWMIEEYMQNPVILFGHDHSQPAVGKMVELTANGNTLEGVIKFAVLEYDFAKTIWNLVKGGFMGAFSVGFASQEQDRLEDGTVVLKKNRLFEVSIVNVPANQDALAKAKELGLDVSVFEKEGRVLSAKNRSIIQSAHDALGAVLGIPDVEEDKSIVKQDADNGTSQGRGVSRARDSKKVAMTALNKALRALHREQRTNY